MPEITVTHVGDMGFETQIGNHKRTIDLPPENNGKTGDQHHRSSS